MLDDSLPLEGKLTKLSWSNVPEIDLPALKYLAQSDDIEAFSVEYEPVADWLAGLSPLKNIKDLSILGNERLDRGQPTILTVTPEGLQHIKDWNNLRSLHFQRLQVQRTGVRAFGKTTTSLSMSECRLATDSTADISKLRSLKELSLHSEDYDFGVRDLHALGQLENLETLHVSGPLANRTRSSPRLKHLRELRSGRSELQFSDVLNLFTKDSHRSPAAATTMLLQAERKSDGSVVELKLERLTLQTTT